jgi:NTP pyrophosphatase (non-canonical NTP hydrolase)
MTEENELYRKALEKWGETSQLDMVVEECAELIQAIQKFKRNPNASKYYANVVEESVDVELCQEQLKILFPDRQLREHFDTP